MIAPNKRRHLLKQSEIRTWTMGIAQRENVTNSVHLSIATPVIIAVRNPSEKNVHWFVLIDENDDTFRSNDYSAEKIPEGWHLILWLNMKLW